VIQTLPRAVEMCMTKLNVNAKPHDLDVPDDVPLLWTG
jgi:hypothetical protein